MGPCVSLAVRSGNFGARSQRLIRRRDRLFSSAVLSNSLFSFHTVQGRRANCMAYHQLFRTAHIIFVEAFSPLGSLGVNQLYIYLGIYATGYFRMEIRSSSAPGIETT